MVSLLQPSFARSSRFPFLLLFVALLLLLLAGAQALGWIQLPFWLYATVAAALLLLAVPACLYQCHNAGTAQQTVTALRDALTHLPNHPLFLEHLDHSLAIARRQEKAMAVINLDIDRLTEVNQQYGYKEGDRLIANIATRLHDLLRESDTVGRLGGSGFGVILNLLDTDEEVERALQRLVDGMHLPFLVGDANLVLNISYGICTYPKNQGSPEELNHYAALALNAAKQDGGNCYRYYNAEMNAHNEQRLSQEYDLRKALEDNEFCLYFQPKVDAASGQIKGMEALIRWQHPKRGLVSPMEFIPLLEDSGMIIEAGDWVLREACRLNKQWQDQGFEPIRVSVNVSSLQFTQGDFIERLQKALTDSGLAAEYLEVELTESCLMADVTRNIDILHEIKKMGVAISIDDFGTGYSSLSYLKKFPIDTLKIDRSFISNVQDRSGGDNAAIVTAIMALSHSLRLDVVAEGVETAQELSYLHALGCRTIQGFLFSKPLSEEEFTRLQQDSMHMKNVLEQVRAELSR